MPLNENNEQGSIRQEIQGIIKGFSACLLNLKEEKVFLPYISSMSESLINGWGNPNRPLFLSQGNENTDIFILDSEESLFSGDAGELLIKILKAMNLTRDHVFICNCLDMDKVHEKIEMIAPKVIITLGQKACRLLMNTDKTIEQLRGRFYDLKSSKIMPTFHPSILVSDSRYKRPVWEDMQMVMSYAGLDNGS